MKTLLNIFLVFIFFIKAFAQPIEPSMFDMVLDNSTKNNTPLKESNNSFIYEDQKKIENFENQTNNLFLFIEKIPEKVFVNQIFSIKIKALSEYWDDDSELVLSIKEDENIEWLNLDSNWDANQENIFTKTLFVKLKSNDCVLPPITLKILDTASNTIRETTKLSVQTPLIENIKIGKKFSGVFANELIVTKFKASKFDLKNTIIVLEIETQEGNLKDFNLNNMLRQGIDFSEDIFPKQRIYYFAIFDNNKKEFEFSYYNLLNKNFESISLPIFIEEDEVSTQVGLNPKESPFELYKEISIYIIIGILFIIFLVKKKYIYLIFAILICIYTVYDRNPFDKISIKEKTQIRILPTEKSTIFFTTTNKIEAEKLGKREKFIKILLPNNKIGWIKEDDIVKN